MTYASDLKKMYINKYIYIYKSCKQKILNILMCADRNTDTKKKLKQTETDRKGQKQTEAEETDRNRQKWTETDRKKVCLSCVTWHMSLEVSSSLGCGVCRRG